MASAASLEGPTIPAEATRILDLGCGVGQCLFQAGSFDCVIAGVAMPYIDIPRALAEARRVLQPGGHLRLSLHSLVYFWAEYLGYLRGHRWKSIIYKFYVLANGITFHFTGRLFRFTGC